MGVAAPCQESWTAAAHPLWALPCSVLLLLTVSARCDSGGITFLRLKGACAGLLWLIGVPKRMLLRLMYYWPTLDSLTSINLRPHPRILVSMHFCCNTVLSPPPPAADYAADLFDANDPIMPALKTTERWFGPDHGILQQHFLANSQPPALHDWQAWDVTFQVSLSLCCRAPAAATFACLCRSCGSS